ncbi:MAG: FIG056164: rhomboid family serine protease, partial [uncultured Thermoleophilia bacterium]
GGAGAGRAGGADAPDVDVHARRPAAPRRQHAVPLHLRQQRRGRHGAAALPALLPGLRPRRRPAAVRDQPGLRHPEHRRERCHRGRPRRLPAAPSSRARPDRADAGRVLLRDRDPRRVRAGRVVRPPGGQRLGGPRHAGHGRRRLLGPRGRLRGGLRARPGVRARSRRRATPDSALRL